MTNSEILRLELPNKIARELIDEGVAEEAVRVRDFAEIARVSIDAVNTGSAVVALVGGAIALRRLTNAMAAKIRNHTGPGSTRLTITHEGQSFSVELDEDPDVASTQIKELLSRVTTTPG